MTDDERNEIEDMIFKRIDSEIESVKSEFQDDIRRLEIENENLRNEMENS